MAALYLHTAGNLESRVVQSIFIFYFSVNRRINRGIHFNNNLKSDLKLLYFFTVMKIQVSYLRINIYF